jgi:phosphoenolpyruvate synthase/pyruvate phosphate dikinase
MFLSRNTTRTYLNVQTTPDVIQAVKKCFASLFTDRAINYRVASI